MTSQTIFHSLAPGAATLFVALTLATAAHADIVSSNPNLPVLYPSAYYTNGSAHATFSAPGVTIALTNLGFAALGSVSLTPSGANELETYSSMLLGDGSVVGLGHLSFSATGTATTLVFNRIGNTTGTFSTELLSMSLSALTPFGSLLIRESPTQTSAGQTTITSLGGGQYQIGSYFDVFTELSLDGGATWIPDTTGPQRITLVAPVPEPSTYALAGLAAGLFALKRARWCRKK